MTEQQRAQAVFFARLASIPTPTETMTEGEKLRFHNEVDRDFAKVTKGVSLMSPAWDRAQRRQRARESGLDALSARDRTALDAQFLAVSSYVQGQYAAIARRQSTKSAAREMQRDWAHLIVDVELPKLHTMVRHTLTALCDGPGVTLPQLFDDQTWAAGPPVVRWRLYNGQLHEDVLGVAPHEHTAGDFVALLHTKPFPFGRCEVCGKFFVRVRRQRCCSRSCTTQAIEGRRRGKRRDYMRRLMQQRRAIERQRREAAERKQGRSGPRGTGTRGRP